jgi:hypothetical protein
MITTILLGVIAVCAVWLVAKGIRDDLREESFKAPTEPELQTRIKKMEDAGRPMMTEREKLRAMSPPEIRSSGYHSGDLIHDTKHKKADMLIPQDLSEEDKQILRDFYNL